MSVLYNYDLYTYVVKGCSRPVDLYRTALWNNVDIDFPGVCDIINRMRITHHHISLHFTIIS